VIAVAGEIGIVMANADQGQKDLEEKNGEREKADRVEDLLLDQKRVPPVAHLGKRFFMFGLEP
jgi:hypothetical protein